MRPCNAALALCRRCRKRYCRARKVCSYCVQQREMRIDLPPRDCHSVAPDMVIEELRARAERGEPLTPDRRPAERFRRLAVGGYTRHGV